MAPKAAKARGHKSRGEKKKKEEKTLPTVVDVVVNLPEGKPLLLKGISTDRLVDVRRLLAVHGDAAHFTHYSLAHQVRGTQLRESLEITSLKPCVLDLVEEDYTEEAAAAHVRRLLDIVSCTGCFGASAKEREAAQQGEGAEAESREGAAEGPQGAEGKDGKTESDDEQGDEDERGEGRGRSGNRSGITAEKVSSGRELAAGEGRSGVPREEAEERKGVVGSGDGGAGERKLVPFKGKPEAAAAMAAAAAATEKGDMTGMCATESKLGQFYEFLSASHLTPPVQSIRRRAKQPQLHKDDFFVMDVRLCTGKLIAVTAGRQGFSGGRQLAVERTLVGLLQRISCAFAKAYEELQEFFVERNKFGNTPFGFRSNTWLVPPPAAANPKAFPPLPVEDEAWGGSGGGQGQLGAHPVPRDWARDLALLAQMPCKTAEERLGRDRKAFLLHNLFVDTAIRRAVASIEEVEAASRTAQQGGDPALENDTSTSSGGSMVGGGSTTASVKEVVLDNLRIVVFKDPCDASVRGSAKLELDPELGRSPEEVAERCLLKGLTADESTAIHDSATLGTLLLHHRGYTVRVQVAAAAGEEGGQGEVEIEAQPDGGANALNANSLRTLLHPHSATSAPPAPASTGASALEPSAAKAPCVRPELEQAEGILHKVLAHSVANLDAELPSSDKWVRWELGACWVQHLQTPPPAAKEGASGKGMAKPEEQGQEREEGRRGSWEAEEEAEGAEEEQKKAEGEGEGEGGEEEDGSGAEEEVRQKLSAGEFQRLKDSKTGLHRKSVAELLEGAKSYYSEIALPKLVADFGSLELSPVDGRTLTDFMHTRGLRMRSLGRVAEQAEKLPHIRSLCIHEMVARAHKRLLRATVSATTDPTLLPAVIAAALNAILGARPRKAKVGVEGKSALAVEIASNGGGGVEEGGKAEEKERAGREELEEEEEEEDGEGEEEGGRLRALVWRWAEMFVKQRFGWEVERKEKRALRKLALLRALCLKVGIEIAPRTYDLNAVRPFRPVDIVSLFPIYKHVACTTADGRMLLESSKTALDKGRLDEAVACGTKALARLVAVCGPYHRMTAGAYSLLAVVLYHTGDFNQATIYQQKALDINERELGLDHPDTMKSYGDLAVFYYRLQHTELALKYVNRALYLLHLTCGPSHPNTAATYINIAMMEEGLGNVHLALRYLHEALKCNQRLLGPDHIQTAASYHAIAIALSLMEAYSLSKQHEQTTLQILQDKLGPEDLRTQDAAAWLDYFDSKAVEQLEAQRTGAPKPDASIASKGHLSVSDLLEYINEEEKHAAHTKALEQGGGKKKNGRLLSSKHGKGGQGHKSSSPRPPAARTSGRQVSDDYNSSSDTAGSDTGDDHEREAAPLGAEETAAAGSVREAAEDARASALHGGTSNRGASTESKVEPAEVGVEAKGAGKPASERPQGPSVAAGSKEEQRGGGTAREEDGGGWQEAGPRGRGSAGGAGRRGPSGGRGHARGAQGWAGGRQLAGGRDHRGTNGVRHLAGSAKGGAGVSTGEAARGIRGGHGGRLAGKPHAGPHPGAGGSAAPPPLPLPSPAAPLEPEAGDQPSQAGTGGAAGPSAWRGVSGQPGIDAPGPAARPAAHLPASQHKAAPPGKPLRPALVPSQAAVANRSLVPGAGEKGRAEEPSAGAARRPLTLRPGTGGKGAAGTQEKRGPPPHRPTPLTKPALSTPAVAPTRASPSPPLVGRAGSPPLAQGLPASKGLVRQAGGQAEAAAGGQGQGPMVPAGSKDEGKTAGAPPAIAPRVGLSWKDVALAPPGTCSSLPRSPLDAPPPQPQPAAVPETTAPEPAAAGRQQEDGTAAQESSGEASALNLDSEAPGGQAADSGGTRAGSDQMGAAAEQIPSQQEERAAEAGALIKEEPKEAEEEEKTEMGSAKADEKTHEVGTRGGAAERDATEGARTCVNDVEASPLEQAPAPASDGLSRLSATAAPFRPSAPATKGSTGRPHGAPEQGVPRGGRYRGGPPDGPRQQYPRSFAPVPRPPPLAFIPMPLPTFQGPANGRMPYYPMYHPHEMQHAPYPPPPMMQGLIPIPPHHHIRPPPHFPMGPPPPPMYQGILGPPMGGPPRPTPPGPVPLESAACFPSPMNPLAQEFVPNLFAKKFNPRAAEFVPGVLWTEGMEGEATGNEGQPAGELMGSEELPSGTSAQQAAGMELETGEGERGNQATEPRADVAEGEDMAVAESTRANGDGDQEAGATEALGQSVEAQGGEEQAAGCSGSDQSESPLEVAPAEQAGEAVEPSASASRMGGSPLPSAKVNPAASGEAAVASQPERGADAESVAAAPHRSENGHGHAERAELAYNSDEGGSSSGSSGSGELENGRPKEGKAGVRTRGSDEEDDGFIIVMSRKRRGKSPKGSSGGEGDQGGGSQVGVEAPGYWRGS